MSIANLVLGLVLSVYLLPNLEFARVNCTTDAVVACQTSRFYVAALRSKLSC